MTKEEARLEEIKTTLQALRKTLPFVDDLYTTILTNREKLVSDIKKLEEEKLALSQGQLLLSTTCPE